MKTKTSEVKLPETTWRAAARRREGRHLVSPRIFVSQDQVGRGVCRGILIWVLVWSCCRGETEHARKWFCKWWFKGHSKDT